MQPPSPALPNSCEYTLSLLIWGMDPGRSIKLTESQEEAGAGRGGDSSEFNPHSSGSQRLLSLLSPAPPPPLPPWGICSHWQRDFISALPGALRVTNERKCKCFPSKRLYSSLENSWGLTHGLEFFLLVWTFRLLWPRDIRGKTFFSFHRRKANTYQVTFEVSCILAVWGRLFMTVFIAMTPWEKFQSNTREVYKGGGVC